MSSCPDTAERISSCRIAANSGTVTFAVEIGDANAAAEEPHGNEIWAAISPL
jgi:hypothetical protein